MGSRVETDDERLRRDLMQIVVWMEEYEGDQRRRETRVLVRIREILNRPTENPVAIESLRRQVRDLNNRIDDTEFFKLRTVDLEKEIRLTHDACARWKERAVKSERKPGRYEAIGARIDLLLMPRRKARFYAALWNATRRPR